MNDIFLVLAWGTVVWLAFQIIANVIRLYRVWKDRR